MNLNQGTGTMYGVLKLSLRVFESFGQLCKNLYQTFRHQLWKPSSVLSLFPPRCDSHCHFHLLTTEAMQTAFTFEAETSASRLYRTDHVTTNRSDNSSNIDSRETVWRMISNHQRGEFYCSTEVWPEQNDTNI